MKDIFGTKINIGDTVAFTPPHYKDLVCGKVIGFTPKMVKIQWLDRSWNTQERNSFPSNVVVKINI
jgi:hypothetical protein